MNSNAGPARRVRQVAGGVAAFALFGFVLPALAVGGPARTAQSSESLPTADLAGFPAGAVGDSRWVIHTDTGRSIAEGSELSVQLVESFTGGALGQEGGSIDYSADHRRNMGGNWLEHGVTGGNVLDDGRFDSDHFCDGRCVSSPGVVPEPDQLVLTVVGLSVVFVLVLHGRRRAR